MLLSEEPKTLRQTARAMGKSTGAIYRVAHRMLDDGLLEADSDPPVRGTMFKASALLTEQLEGDAKDPGSPGSVTAGQRILLTSGSSLTDLYEVLARPKMAAVVSWCTSLGSSTRWLLALDHGVTQVQHDRLVVVLEQNGLRVETGQVAELITGSQIRGAAEELVDSPLADLAVRTHG
jgi:hypothetical protein